MSVKVPVSQCNLWSRLRDYYWSRGVAAWQQDVPFYATCNAHIGHTYARIIWQFVEETLQTRRSAEPITILEIGAGTGMFGFYCLKRLLELQQALDLDSVPFHYVMTDGAEKNVDYWQSHPALADYVKYGCLSFAQYDLGAGDDSPVLDRISSGCESKIPLIVLSNYLFDSLPHDAFRIVDGRLQICLIDQNPKRIDRDNQCVPLDQIDPDLAYRDVSADHYGEADLDEALSGYAEHFDDGHFLYPVGAMRFLRHLRRLTGDNYLLLSSDKAFGRHAKAFGECKPDLAFHNEAISMSVNFDAMGHYLKRNGGDFHLQAIQQSLATAAFAMGRRFSDMPKTNHALIHELSAAGPGNLFNIYTHIAQSHAHCSLEVLVSYLSLTYWDPHIFDCCISSILREVSAMRDESLILGLVEHLPLVRANFYHLPNGTDTLTNIALVYQQVKLYENALDHYELSLSYFGERATTFYNMGLCHFFLDRRQQAKQLFQAAVAMDSNYILARGWIAQIDAESEVLAAAV